MSDPDASARCISTRRGQMGLKRRRYEAPSGERFTTYEVPEALLRAVGLEKVRAALASIERGNEMRRRSALLKAAVAANPGVKSAALALDLGCHESYVRLIRQRLAGCKGQGGFRSPMDAPEVSPAAASPVPASPRRSRGPLSSPEPDGQCGTTRPQ